MGYASLAANQRGDLANMHTYNVTDLFSTATSMSIDWKRGILASHVGIRENIIYSHLNAQYVREESITT